MRALLGGLEEVKEQLAAGKKKVALMTVLAAKTYTLAQNTHSPQGAHNPSSCPALANEVATHFRRLLIRMLRFLSHNIVPRGTEQCPKIRRTSARNARALLLQSKQSKRERPPILLSVLVVTLAYRFRFHWAPVVVTSSKQALKPIRARAAQETNQRSF